MLAFARRWKPDLVVHEPTTFAGPLVAAALGVPSVRNIWGLDFTYATSSCELEALRPLATSLGLKPVDTLGSVTVDPCPPSLQVQYPVRRLPIRFAPYNGPAELPDWLRTPPTRPRVCVTGGTVSGHFSSIGMSFDDRVREALDGQDVELVVLNPAADSSLRSLGVPDGVRVVDRVALHLLFPSCSLVVHSGGGGTAMTALNAGVPQLLIPVNPDHVFNGRRLALAGVARSVPWVTAGRDEIGAAAQELLTSAEVRDTLATVGKEMAEQPSAAEVVAQLCDLVSTGGAR
jgi:UDP:flavonoid glycosyltransferase YjiC (YdhE family)